MVALPLPFGSPAGTSILPLILAVRVFATAGSATESPARTSVATASGATVRGRAIASPSLVGGARCSQDHVGIRRPSPDGSAAVSNFRRSGDVVLLGGCATGLPS